MLGRLLGGQDRLLNFFFPRYCLGCGREGAYFCQRCRRDLPFQLPPFCSKCGKSLDHHPSCDDITPELTALHSVFRFEGVIKKAVHQFKYNNLRDLAGPLGGYLSEYLKLHDLTADALVPVPLHRSRLRERGYNQSELLAIMIHRLTDTPVFVDTLRKNRQTRPQAESQSVNDRRDAVAGAFQCYNNKLSGRSVILIDDVATSGATLNACARALIAGGAAEVKALTLAREI